VTDGTNDGVPGARSWWLALAALAVCAPWPGWRPDAAQLVLVVGLLVILARPRGLERVAWLGVVAALAGALAPVAPGVSRDRLENELDSHVRTMLAAAESLVKDDRLTRLFTVTGEASDPVQPFEILAAAARGAPGRTFYLADDRGNLVAWGGEDQAFPVALRPLGPRAWGVEWSAAGGMLHLREPIIVEGRMVGSVTVGDRAALTGSAAWGMTAPGGRRLVLGSSGADAVEVAPEFAAGVAVRVGSEVDNRRARRGLFGAGWMVVFLVGISGRPKSAWSAVVLVAAVALSVSGELAGPEWMVLVLAAGASVGRLARELPEWWARVLLVATAGGAAAVRLTGYLPGVGSWLPEHLLRPGWGGVWVVAAAWAAAGWPGLSRGRPFLERRVLAAVWVAAMIVAVELLWIPVQLVAGGAGDHRSVVLPRGSVSASEIWPAAPAKCRLDDAAPVLAQRWGLDRWSTPSELTIVDAEGFAVSSWGDLSPAGDRRRTVEDWSISGTDGLRVELAVAEEPWSLLEDWASGEPRESVWHRSVWSAVLTRSGTVAATLHPEIRSLDPAAAGDAYHAGAAWTRIAVGDDLLPARVVRRGDWLVAAVAHPPEPPVWVVRSALAVVWIFLGLMVARPPVVRREKLATFGGRLRLLVAGGVVIPLVVLTLFLQLRLGREENRLEEVIGRDTLEAARYTIEHLGDGAVIDDGLAAWLARGWGCEVTFFDHTRAAGVSRRDLMSVGRLAQMPAVEAYPGFLLGRSEAVISRREGQLMASGSVVVGEQRALLQLHRADLLRAGIAPDAVDWVLTGGFLAALVALIATGRIEERLGASLRDLVGLARRLVRGEPVGRVRRPRETDLAEVIDAVRSMNEEVRRRELSLRHQEELLRITLTSLSPAVLLLEPDGTVSFANPSAEALLEEHGELVHEEVGKLAAGVGDAPAADVTLLPYPGRDLTWRLGVAAVPLPDGRSGLVAVIDDVTEVVRADRLQQLNQLARIVAHEVKNPLTPIRLWVQELSQAGRRRDPDLDRLIEEASGEIAVQVRRLQDTASSFSNLVALEHWRPEVVDLTEVVGAATEGLGVLGRRGIELETRVPPAGKALVMADRQWLARAVANLVQNSVDALEDRSGRIELRVAEHPGTVALEVEDTGGGVAADQLADLFSPYFSTTASGSGLGLALVHHVVTRCQGSVEAANGEHGLRVRIELPRASA
jgi:signal transduction histidine kinase